MKILAIGAHIDDIEIACGGTLAKSIENGHDVKCLIMSKSGYTNLNGQIQRSEREAVEEGLYAMKLLGITNIEILDFQNKEVAFSSETVNAIEKSIAEFNPDIIFTHHPFDTHQDHEGVSKATIAAARRKNTVFFYEPIRPSGRSYISFKPVLYVDIEAAIGKKINSLRAHKSEYDKFGGEDWIDGITNRCKFRGYEIGKKYAEAFETLRIEMHFDSDTNL